MQHTKAQMEVKFGVESSQIMELDAMCKVQIFPKLAKVQMHCRPFQYPWLFLFGAKDQDQLVTEVNQVIISHFMFPKVHLQACFGPHVFSEKTTYFLPPNHPITFIINMEMCSTSKLSLKIHNHLAAKSNFLFKNRDSFYEFQRFSTQTNHPKSIHKHH